MTAWDATTLSAAIEGLRDRADELSDYPTRLHVGGVQPRDLLGAPKLSPEFWRWLTGSIHATHPIREEVVCPLRHDYETDCARCGGVGSYVITRDVYTRPLARALSKLVNAKTNARPHPLIVIQALLAEGFSIERTAMRYGVIIMTADQRITEEARILAAIRALRSRYEDTVLGPRPKWTELSESQQNAADAA